MWVDLLNAKLQDFLSIVENTPVHCHDKFNRAKFCCIRNGVWIDLIYNWIGKIVRVSLSLWSTKSELCCWKWMINCKWKEGLKMFSFFTDCVVRIKKFLLRCGRICHVSYRVDGSWMWIKVFVVLMLLQRTNEIQTMELNMKIYWTFFVKKTFFCCALSTSHMIFHDMDKVLQRGKMKIFLSRTEAI